MIAAEQVLDKVFVAYWGRNSSVIVHPGRAEIKPLDFFTEDNGYTDGMQSLLDMLEIDEVTTLSTILGMAHKVWRVR